jgi:hypothetical protein
MSITSPHSSSKPSDKLSMSHYPNRQPQRTASGLMSQLTKVASAGAVALSMPLAVLSLTALGLTTAPTTAIAAEDPNYYSCATEMTAAGVAEADAIAACATARYPQDLGACVSDINELTSLTANDALAVCGRSRRPLEVASCTVDIHEAFLTDPSTAVLANCGRSLLPERYSTCVIDIIDATEIVVDEALTQCSRAGYRPWAIQPRS